MIQILAIYKFNLNLIHRYDHIKISGEKVDKPKHVFSESIIPSGSTKLNKGNQIDIK